MRLDAHAKAGGGRPFAAAAQGARGPAVLAPFFAGMTEAARSALERSGRIADPRLVQRGAVLVARDQRLVQAEMAKAGLDHDCEAFRDRRFRRAAAPA
jgi:hypothetical protein